jgi:hypothetical protein
VNGVIWWGFDGVILSGAAVVLWVLVLVQRYVLWRRRRNPLAGTKTLTGVSPFDESGVLTVGGKATYRYRRQTATSVVLLPMRPWHHVARRLQRWRFRLRRRVRLW